MRTVLIVVVALVPFVFFISYAFGDSGCSTVRMDEPGGPFARIPVYNQKLYSKKDSNICYAISVSELIDAHRFNSGNRELAQLTSPISVALNYKLSSNAILDPKLPTSLGRGDEFRALGSTNGKMVCDQKWMNRFSPLLELRIHRGRINYTSAPENVDQFISDVLDEIEIFQSILYGLNIHGEASPKCTEVLRKYNQFGFSNLGDLLDVVRLAVTKSNPLEKAQAFIAGMCKSHEFAVNIPAPETFTRGKMPSDKMLNEIAAMASDPNFSKALAQEAYQRYLRQSEIDTEYASQLKLTKVNKLLDGAQPTPVAISFNPSIFEQEEASSISNHVAVITGRRMTSKGCEFLVRDSYGPSCHDSEGKARYNFPCTQGSVWIPAARLMKATYGLTWIQR